MDTQGPQAPAWGKGQLINLAAKNARVQSGQVQSQNRWKRLKVLKTENSQIPTPLRIGPLITNIIGPQSGFSHGSLCQWEAKQRITASTKCKTVVGPDDYASMQEVIRRRYSRVMRDGLTPPDLNRCGGGQGQG